jgi:hypothetical protein
LRSKLLHLLLFFLSFSNALDAQVISSLSGNIGYGVFNTGKASLDRDYGYYSLSHGLKAGLGLSKDLGNSNFGFELNPTYFQERISVQLYDGYPVMDYVHTNHIVQTQILFFWKIPNKNFIFRAGFTLDALVNTDPIIKKDKFEYGRSTIISGEGYEFTKNQIGVHCGLGARSENFGIFFDFNGTLTPVFNNGKPGNYFPESPVPHEVDYNRISLSISGVWYFWNFHQSSE